MPLAENLCTGAGLDKRSPTQPMRSSPPTTYNYGAPSSFMPSPAPSMTALVPVNSQPSSQGYFGNHSSGAPAVWLKLAVCG